MIVRMTMRIYSKTCLKRPLKEGTKIGFQERLSQIQSRLLQNAPREHSAILSTFIKLQLVFKAFVCLFLSGLIRQVSPYIETSI